MLTGFILLIATGILWAQVGVVVSQLARRGIPYALFTLLTTCSALALAAIFLVDWSAVSAASPARIARVVSLMLASGMLSASAFLLMTRAMQSGHHATIWTVSQAAFLWPFLFGVLALGDRPSPPRYLGMALIVVGLILFGRARRSDSPATPQRHHWFALTLVVFLLLGIAQTITTIPSALPNWADVGRLRLPALFAGLAIVYALVAITNKQKIRPPTAGLAIAQSLVSITSQSLFFLAMDRLAQFRAVGLAYPIAISICLLAFAAYSRIFLREPATPTYWTALLFTLTGIALTAIP